MKLLTCLVVLLAAAAWQGGAPPQDPPSLPPLEPAKPEKKANEPKGEIPLPPPLRAGEQATDASGTPNPFLGVWNVTAMARPGAAMARPQGYVIFTPTFMSMHVGQAAATPVGGSRFQSSFRRYQVRGVNLVTTTVSGVMVDDRNNSAMAEPSGRVEMRRFAFLTPNTLRIVQGPDSFLDLTRVERF